MGYMVLLSAYSLKPHTNPSIMHLSVRHIHSASIGTRTTRVSKKNFQISVLGKLEWETGSLLLKREIPVESCPIHNQALRTFDVQITETRNYSLVGHFRVDTQTRNEAQSLQPVHWQRI